MSIKIGIGKILTHIFLFSILVFLVSCFGGDGSNSVSQPDKYTVRFNDSTGEYSVEKEIAGSKTVNRGNLDSKLINEPEPEYVPGEILVKFKSATSVSSSKKSSIEKLNNFVNARCQRIAAKYNLKLKRLIDPVQIIKKYKSKLIKRKGRVILMGKSYRSVNSVDSQTLYQSAYSEMDTKAKALLDIYKAKIGKDIKFKQILSELQNDPHVEFAEPNYIYKGSYSPVGNPRYAEQWAHKVTGAEAGWDITKGFIEDPLNPNKKPVVVAVIDSGIDYNHEDIKDILYRDKVTNQIIGKDFVDIDKDWFVKAGYDVHYDEDCTIVDDDPYDIHGHGTHCSGIIAATDNNLGVVGVAPMVKIMPIKAAFAYYGRYFSSLFPSEAIVQSIYFAADNGADIISMSYGSGWYSNAQKTALDYAYSKNIVLVASAGNSKNHTRNYPASYDNVIAVGELGQDSAGRLIAKDKSNYGYWVDLAAPGTNILSAVTSYSHYPEYKIYQSWSGSSMACPYVAGVAALMLSVDPSLTNYKVRRILRSTTVPYADKNSVYVGTGCVNVKKALDVVVAGNMDMHAEFLNIKDNQACIKNGLNDILDLIVKIKADRYQLSYSLGDNGASGSTNSDPLSHSVKWNLVASGNSVNSNNYLLANFDYSKIKAGYCTFRLKYENGACKDEIYKTILVIDNKKLQNGFANTIHLDSDISFSSPIVVDLNNDSKKEIIVVGTEKGTSRYHVNVFTSSGQLYFASPIVLDAEYVNVHIGDVSGDLQKELVLDYGVTSSTDQKRLLAVYNNGVQSVAPVVISEGDNFWARISIANIDNVDKDEILLVSQFNDTTGTVSSVAKKLTIYNGSLVKLNSFDLGGEFLNQIFPVRVSDIDGDGKMEMILSLGKKLNVFKVKTLATPPNTFAFEKMSIFDSNVFPGGISRVVISDLDKDGQQELVISESFIEGSTLYTGKLHMLNSLGNKFSVNWPLGINLVNFSIADVNHDGIQEIVGKSSAGDIDVIDMNADIVHKIKSAVDEYSW